MKNNFTNLRQAFEVYNRDYRKQIAMAFDEVYKSPGGISSDLFDDACDLEYMGLLILQTAFHEDTKEYNSLPNCMLVTLKELENIIK